MSQQKVALKKLIHKYLENQISPEEYKELWLLLNASSDEEPLDQELIALWQSVKQSDSIIPPAEWEKKMQLGKDKIEQDIQSFKKVKSPIFFKRYKWIAAAAVFLIVATSIVVSISSDQKEIYSNTKKQQPKQDRLPGGDKAILTLSDGSTIILDSAVNGVLAKQGNTSVVKKNDGQLEYNSADGQTNEVAYNLLQTPRGGQYKITLPDGSKVWLNAASSLKYPVVFAGNERRVDISGEAYFEIVKDVTKPFKVHLNNMEVEVLGTHFNVNGYEDEESVKTTLVEGKVKVASASGTKFLNPGQQAQLKPSGNIAITNNINLEEIIAWKDGNFQFENADIKAVMRQLARWYDVDVTYKGNIQQHFVGSISRNVNLSQVLTMLQQTGAVKFKIDGKQLIVMP
ncbi:FecR family protein [Sediminibacterium sp.]|uniref:FecR family protein n=1 Tax=Sediminibacterium sp. TaxID=1917865 RepID=UPI003F6FE66B